MDKKAIAQHIIDKFLSAGAEKVQCSLTNKVVTEFNYEAEMINLIRTNCNTVISIKAIKEGKKGTAALNSIEEADIDEAVASTMAAIEASVADPAEDISDVAVEEYFETGVFEPDMEGLYDRLAEFTAAVKKEYPLISINSIVLDHTLVENLFLNTNGVCLESKKGYYGFNPMFMAVDGDKTASFMGFGQMFTDINKPIIDHGMCRQLLMENEKSIYTKGIDGKFIGDVIITPACVGDILYSVMSNFLSDGVLIEGTSLYKDKLGKKVASDIFNWALIPRCEEKADVDFYTGEGYVLEDMNLIENGILKSFTLSAYAARKTGNERCKGLSGNFAIKPGNDSIEEMIKSTENGIILNRFSGGQPSTDGDITGVAKNSFRIENGKVTDALSEVMVSGNLAQMLLDIVQISKETVNDGMSILPYIKIKNVTISGK